MKNKLTVTVGIPAYNEENNIGKLLKALHVQKQDQFKLSQIIVVSDGSTDKTEQIVASVNSEIIELIINKKRIGSAKSQNKILSKSTSDVLVILDADILPQNKLFLNEIVKPFSKKDSLGIVGGYPIPLPGKSFFENVINYSVGIKNQVYMEINEGNNLYMCHGRARALSKKFYKTLKWRSSFGEDAFSYLSCIKNGFEFHFEQKAKVKYRSPNNLADHIRQSTRFLRSKKHLKKYFNHSIVDTEYPDYRVLVLKKIPSFFIKNPVYFVTYLFVYVISNLYLLINPNIQESWPASSTTKKL